MTIFDELNATLGGRNCIKRMLVSYLRFHSLAGVNPSDAQYIVMAANSVFYGDASHFYEKGLRIAFNSLNLANLSNVSEEEWEVINHWREKGRAVLKENENA